MFIFISEFSFSLVSLSYHLISFDCWIVALYTSYTLSSMFQQASQATQGALKQKNIRNICKNCVLCVYARKQMLFSVSCFWQFFLLCLRFPHVYLPNCSHMHEMLLSASGVSFQALNFRNIKCCCTHVVRCNNMEELMMMERGFYY